GPPQSRGAARNGADTRFADLQGQAACPEGVHTRRCVSFDRSYREGLGARPATKTMISPFVLMGDRTNGRIGFVAGLRSEAISVRREKNVVWERGVTRRTGVRIRKTIPVVRNRHLERVD